MIQLLPQLHIFLAYQPVDFRKGIDGLVALCRTELAADPYEGHVFVFRNRRGTALKILTFDGHGYWLCLRRFSQGRLRWWPAPQPQSRLHPLQAHQLSVLLYNGLPDRASFVPPWRELNRPFQAATEAVSAAASSPL
jgi:transposase